MQVWVDLRWKDDALRWDSRFFGLKFLRMKATDIWVPDAGFINSNDHFEFLKEITIFPVRSAKKPTKTTQKNQRYRTKMKLRKPTL